MLPEWAREALRKKFNIFYFPSLQVNFIVLYLGQSKILNSYGREDKNMTRLKDIAFLIDESCSPFEVYEAGEKDCVFVSSTDTYSTYRDYADREVVSMLAVQDIIKIIVRATK